MKTESPSILIIADIEGSSGCFDYPGSAFKTDEWVTACEEMTKDVDCVVRALFDAGAKHITVKDFHRTGYNLLTERIDPRARILSGYKTGLMPGLGDPRGHDVVLFIGMHAPSGSDGFLAHTMTSRIRSIHANGKLISEVELFASSLARFGIRPVFFSGCPVACRYAAEAIPGIEIFPIDKSSGRKVFDDESWRKGLAKKAVESISNTTALPYNPSGPFEVEITFRGGEAEARAIARKWKLKLESGKVIFTAADMPELFNRLIDIAYLSPVTKHIAPLVLPIYNLYGRMGINWVRRKLAMRSDTTETNR
ncbi:MAG TPA: M55 family metallopeptidase [Spirochaetota bacterium]